MADALGLGSSDLLVRVQVPPAAQCQRGGMADTLASEASGKPWRFKSSRWHQLRMHRWRNGRRTSLRDWRETVGVRLPSYAQRRSGGGIGRHSALKTRRDNREGSTPSQSTKQPIDMPNPRATMGGMETRTCGVCNKEKDITSFRNIRGKYRSRTCYTCYGRQQYKHNPVACALRERRRRRTDHAGCICKDSKGYDKKKGYSNDLTKEFVAAAILNGCVYCGETGLRMTLDRIDNSKGHTTDNVLAACVRCNFIRGSMPWDAWQGLVSSVRSVRAKGLFGTWEGPKKRLGK